MKKQIYVVSRCLGRKGEDYKFHFVGCYMGRRIESIFVRGGHFVKAEEYLIVLDRISSRKGSLFGYHIKSKKAFI